jgi:hypothetical protein
MRTRMFLPAAAITAVAALGSALPVSAAAHAPETVKLACTTSYSHASGTISGKTGEYTYETRDCSPTVTGPFTVKVTVSGGHVRSVYLDDALFPFTVRTVAFSATAAWDSARAVAPCVQVIYPGDVPFSSMPSISQVVTKG